MSDYDNIYRTITLRSWDEVTDYFTKHRGDFDGWIFRGHQDASWLLKTTLERAVERFGISWAEVPSIEEGLVRRFQRQLHLYGAEVKAEELNFMELLSLMQHHGAPTRLLDWTYSFFVGVYFAIEAAKPDHSCAVWAIDRDWWRKQARDLLPDDVKKLLESDINAKKDETVRQILLHDPPLKTVHPLNAFRLSTRHVLQQGAFLVPGDVTKSFMENLRGMVDPPTDQHIIKLEFQCNRQFLKDGIENLHRMNINRATLFPGLDGFAKHLEALIVVPRARAADKD
jgi:hypothetical protein